MYTYTYTHIYDSIYICSHACIYTHIYIYVIYMTKDLYPDYIKSSYKSIIKRLTVQFKNGQNP